jgi:hypothetical protein
MRDGRLEVTFVEGEIRAVSVSSGLDLVYQRLFEAARLQMKRSDPEIELGIRLIVFGCFWLEAVCNTTLRDFLNAGIGTSPAASAAWEAIQRSPLRLKFSVISAFAKTPDAERDRRIFGEVARAFDLRNRLAHFKEEETEVAGPMTADEFGFKLGEFPEADLIQRLRAPVIDAFADGIVNGIGWLKDIRQAYFSPGS